jgi:hypothetical protein
MKSIKSTVEEPVELTPEEREQLLRGRPLQRKPAQAAPLAWEEIPQTRGGRANGPPITARAVLLKSGKMSITIGGRTAAQLGLRPGKCYTILRAGMCLAFKLNSTGWKLAAAKSKTDPDRVIFKISTPRGWARKLTTFRLERTGDYYYLEPEEQ